MISFSFGTAGFSSVLKVSDSDGFII